LAVIFYENLPMTNGQDITGLLRQARMGDLAAANRLYDLVYLQLHSIARAMLRGDGQRAQLSSCEIVNESYLKLFQQGTTVDFADRRHFYGVAARAMRQVLVEHARIRDALFRFGGQVQVPLDLVGAAPHQGLSVEDVIAIGETRDQLAERHPHLAEVIDFRFFMGLSIEETADKLGVAPNTVIERMKLAKAFLRRELKRRSGTSYAS
jgi:RNA polymerase sigma factor (TIGR02999 family)